MNHLLTTENFPVLYEDQRPVAVLVDIDSFRQMEFILDNILHRAEEPEDAIIAAATDLWDKLITEARYNATATTSDWEQELYDL